MWGPSGEDRQRQHLRWASADIRTLRTQEVGTDVDIWDMSGETWGWGGAWDRSHMGQEGTNQGAGTKLRMNEMWRCLKWD